MDGQTAFDISRSNAFISPQDRVRLTQLAQKCEAELPVLRQQIKETQRQLSVLVSKVEETEKMLTFSRTLSKPSHIRNLPPELLSLVFTFACAGETLQVVGFQQYPPSTLLSLLRVSKYWRDLAFRTKCVWNNFVSVDPNPDQTGFWANRITIPDDSKMFRVMEGVVGLYGKNLSHLFLDCEYIEKVGPCLFDLAFQNQSGLFHLALFNGSQSLKKFGTLEMPMLETLFFWPRRREEESLIKFKAPRLKKVFLGQPSQRYDVTPQKALLPWSQLTHLSFGSPCYEGDDFSVSPTSFIRLLSHLSCLSYLHITEVVWESDTSVSSPPSAVLLPSLKVLEIYDHCLWFLDLSNTKSLLLPFISAPSLEIFDLFFSIVSDLDDWKVALRGALVSFFHHTHSLTQIRLVSFSEDLPIPFWLDHWGYRDRDVLQLSGNGLFFTHLSQIAPDQEGSTTVTEFGKRRIQGGRKDGDSLGVWTDRIIDRYINKFPVASHPRKAFTSTVQVQTGQPNSPTPAVATLDEGGGSHVSGSCGDGAEDEPVPLSLEERVKIYRKPLGAVFALLGDPLIPAHVERHAYLVLDS